MLHASLIPLGFAAFFLIILAGMLLGTRNERRPANDYRATPRRRFRAL